MNILSVRDQSFSTFGSFQNVKYDGGMEGVDKWKGWLAKEFFDGENFKLGVCYAKDVSAATCLVASTNGSVSILGGNGEVFLKVAAFDDERTFRLSFGEYVTLKEGTSFMIYSNGREPIFCYLFLQEGSLLKPKIRR